MLDSVKLALLILVGLITLFIVIIGVEVFLAMSGRPPAYVNKDTGVRVFDGFGPSLSYVVMGDSTAAGEGAEYDKGIAIGSAQHLAGGRRIAMTNLGVSGSTAAEVVLEQLPDAIKLKPDVVLLSVGANDVVARTGRGKVESSLQKIADGLVAANCDVKIVMTGAPDMGAIPRFAQPLRTVAGLQTSHLNARLYPWITNNNYTLAAIARDTGPAFRENPKLFGGDRFHPNAKGYEVWLKTINPALDNALAKQPSHCKP